MDSLTVLDLFCGAGGFSEGFRQQGFKILLGIDNWRPAIETYNHNFNLDCSVRNILDFAGDVKLIEELPNTSVILGSPPCVSFSSSNRSGKADKSLGIQLIETFFRVVAVKKHRPNSLLTAWFMENVPRSLSSLRDGYSFADLNLSEWAFAQGFQPDEIAINLKGNSMVITASDYGSPQSRKRVISGEFVPKKRLLEPNGLPTTAFHPDLPRRNTVSFIKQALGPPPDGPSNQLIQDPNYPHLRILKTQLSDHFYDTGLYHSEWANSKFLKTNHPYMGIMSFPENEDKPSRTITATKIGTSREAIIYRSEFERKGDGEFRTPTVREAATLMGFPLTYQFKGSEGAKWRLVGNAVCPCVSRIFASMVRSELLLKPIRVPITTTEPSLDGIQNLNTFKERIFNNPPKRNVGSRFRRHPFKTGNITVTLSNYDIIRGDKDVAQWQTSVQYGNGEGFPTIGFPDGAYKEIEPSLRSLPGGAHFIEVINNGFSERIADAKTLQRMYEEQSDFSDYLEPTRLVERVAELIEGLGLGGDFVQDCDKAVFPNKQRVPQKQLFALYAINKICTVANRTKS